MNKSTYAHHRIISKLAGLLTLGVILLAGVSLFALFSSHKHSQKTLQEINLLQSALHLTQHAQVTFKIQIQEWKNTLLRGHSPEDLEKYTLRFNSLQKEIQTTLTRLQTELSALPHEIAFQSSISRLLTAHRELHSTYLQALQTFPFSQQDAPFLIDAQVRGLDRTIDAQFDTLAQNIYSESSEIITELEKSTEAYYQKQRFITSIVSLVVIALAFILVIFFNRSHARIS